MDTGDGVMRSSSDAQSLITDLKKKYKKLLDQDKIRWGILALSSHLVIS